MHTGSSLEGTPTGRKFYEICVGGVVNPKFYPYSPTAQIEPFVDMSNVIDAMLVVSDDKVWRMHTKSRRPETYNK